MGGLTLLETHTACPALPFSGDSTLVHLEREQHGTACPPVGCTPASRPSPTEGTRDTSTLIHNTYGAMWASPFDCQIQTMETRVFTGTMWPQGS